MTTTRARCDGEGWSVVATPFLLPRREAEKNPEELLRLNRRGLGTDFSRGRLLVALALLAGAAVVVVRVGSVHPAAKGQDLSVYAAPAVFPFTSLSRTPQIAARQIARAYDQIPLIFEANQGQSDAQVKFLAHGNGYGLFLTPEEAVLVLQQPAARAGLPTRPASVVRLQLAKANPSPEISAADELPGKSNYLIGRDPRKWHRNVPQFSRVRYHSVYPGIDLVYYGRPGQLEYDFEIAPGADPSQVSWRVESSDENDFEQPRLDRNGDLLLATAGGQVRFAAPHVYQKNGDREQTVAGRFALGHHGAVGFEIGAYDRSRLLIIDPVVNYSTYLGGNGAESCSAITGAAFTPGCPSIAVDSASDAYIAGATTSTVAFPIPTGAPTPAPVNGPADVFITKFDNTGSVVLFTTFLGGSGTDTPAGIAVDSGFDVIVAGTTNSPDFPTVGAFQAAPKTSGNHVFVTRLDPTGAAPVYSTYLSGSATDTASGVAVDLLGKIYVTGTTTSLDFPTTIGSFQPASLATNQFFMAKVDPSSTQTLSLPYSTYFGGGNPANGVAVGGGVAVDSSQNVYITGGTNFLHVGSTNDFPILNATQTCLDLPEAVVPTTAVTCTNATALDAFVAKIDPLAASGAQLEYSTYIGGTGDDIAYGISVDSGGNAYITGSTTSIDFPLATTTVPFQAGNSGLRDAFVAKLATFTPTAITTTTTTTAEAVGLIYSSYLGGAGDDVGTSIAADTVGGARITGWTNSTATAPLFPVQSPVQATPGGGVDAFVADLDTTAAAACLPVTTGPTPVYCPTYSSFLGGPGTDMGTGIAVDFLGATYVTGETTSAGGFPPPPPAMQGALNGPSDAFVVKVGPNVQLAMTANVSPSPVGVGNEVTFTYTINNIRDAVSGVTFTDNFSATSPNATFVSATTTTGSCGTQVTGGSVQCNLGTLSTTASGTTGSTVTVILTPTPATTTTTVPPALPPPLGNSGTVAVPGTTFQASAGASATVNDFSISVAPATQTVAAGGFAAYIVSLTPTGAIPGTINLKVGSTLPTGVTSTFTTNPFPNLSNGPVSTVLNVNTTQRVTTTVKLFRPGGPLYAGWLPVSGLALLGFGVGGKRSRKRRWLLGLALGGFLTLMLLQAGCGNSTTTTTTTGTPAGTYTLTVSATSGTATRTTTVQLIVQ
jgi:hypothetical protein